MAGVSSSTVRKLENGRLMLTVEVFVKLTHALHRRPSYFLGDEDGAVDRRLIRRDVRRHMPAEGAYAHGGRS
jgi:transcriptional regulator with XRE-family HTH domain